MAGTIYEVFGLPRYSPLEDCPDWIQGKKVILKSNDGFVSQVPAEAAWLSTGLQNIIVESGFDNEISLPLKQSTMSKLVEYLNYHKDKPVNEIQTPLPSDRLAECGVSSWDAKFIAVDNNALLELILAASLLGVQSLFFLAGARVATMNKDKPEAKLRKEAGLTDDLPEDEAMTVQTEYANAMWRKVGWTEQDAEALAAPSLASASAVLGGLLGAAAKSEALDLERRAGEFAVDLKSWRHANWRVAVLQSWRALENAPDEVRDDRDLLLAAIVASGGEAFRFASTARKRDRGVALEAVKHRGAALGQAASELSTDREFVLQCVVARPEALAHATPKLRADRGLVLEAARQGRGAALQGAATELPRDSDFVLELVGLDAEAYKYAAEFLREKREFALAAARKNGLALKHMSHAFRADRQIVATAVRSDPEAVVYSHTSCRRDLGQTLPCDTDGRTVGELMAEDWRGQYEQPKPHLGPWMSLYVEDDKLMCQYQCFKYDFNVSKAIQFSASNVMTANMGQSNYISANSYLDKMPFYERPEKEAITLMWGAVTGIGMRLKAFGSQDFLNYTPEAQTTVEEAKAVFRVTVAFQGLPEWYNVQMYDPMSREAFLRPTAGYGTGGGWMGESAEVPAHRATQGRLRDGEAEEEEAPAKARRAPRRREAAGEPEPPLSPLAGWPGLTGAPEAPAGGAAALAAGGGSFAEGARVMLVNMKAKNGQMGTLVKRHGNGRWKICMDGSGGHASLKEENLALVGASAAQPLAASPPLAPAQPEAAPAVATVGAGREGERRERFHVVGSWSGWAEPQEMLWDRSSRCYKFRLRLAYRTESFQLLHEASWDSCLHPPREICGAPGVDYEVEGPESRQKCRGLHWTIGNHEKDQGSTGAQYDVKLYVGASGKATKVCWRRVAGAVVRQTG